jgi:ferredoxin
MSMRIVAELCTSCGDCEPECPTESIKPRKGVYAVKAESCNECEGEFDSPRCAEICPIERCVVGLAA